jgi:hypothetical protein
MRASTDSPSSSGAEKSFPSSYRPKVPRSVESSAATWQSETCFVPTLKIEVGAFAAAREADGRNTIAWVADGWSERGFDPSAPAQTRVEFQRNSRGIWEIVEADVFLNADDFSWSESGAGSDVTLGPVLLHELGHVLGLLHPCGDDAPGVPACSASTEFDATVMNPAYSPDRAELSADDAAGTCVLYGERPDGCTSDDDCGPTLRCDSSSNCVSGDGQLDDSCASARDCRSGGCLEGRCSIACKESSECSAGSTCAVGEDGVAGCVSSLRSAGESCSQSEECSSQLCVVDERGAGYCTNSCETDAMCPQDWKCGAAHAPAVCVPNPVAARGGACSFSVEAPLHGGLGFLPFIASLWLRRRNSKKS